MNDPSDPTSTSPADDRSPAHRLLTLREEGRARLARLEHDVTGVVEASHSSNADDEHDPEGATIAFEREQLTALVHQARERLAAVDEAIDRVSAGTYGRCSSCGGPIGDDRLAALPTTTRCRACA